MVCSSRACAEAPDLFARGARLGARCTRSPTGHCLAGGARCPLVQLRPCWGPYTGDARGAVSVRPQMGHTPAGPGYNRNARMLLPSDPIRDVWRICGKAARENTVDTPTLIELAKVNRPFSHRGYFETGAGGLRTGSLEHLLKQLLHF